MLHILVGRRETGKTTLEMFLARHGDGRRLVFDPSNRIFPRAGGVKVVSADALIDDAYPAMLAGELTEIIYAPMDGTRDGFLAWSEIVLHHVVHAKAHQLSVVVDECGLVAGELDNIDQPLHCAMRWCRRDRVHFFLSCHQPKNIPTNTRAISDYLIFFHTTQEHDLKVIAERCSVEFADKVARLQPLHFRIWDDQHAREQLTRTTPARWRVAVDEPAPAAVDSLPSVDAGNLWA